jgi:hypothetical protein
MKRAFFGFIAIAVLLMRCPPLPGADERNAVVEHSKPLVRTTAGLGTTFYAMSPAEKKATNGWSEQELSSGSPKTTTLKGAIGRRIAWFGIVREVVQDKTKNETRLSVEMKYFDGLTDLHLQIVSMFGAGDFRVVIPGMEHRIKKLSLVRVYGKVVSELDGLPVVSAQYVRVWDWKLFAFMPYGNDKSNPQWVKLRQVGKDDFYSSGPDDRYYEERIGSR